VKLGKECWGAPTNLLCGLEADERDLDCRLDDGGCGSRFALFDDCGGEFQQRIPDAGGVRLDRRHGFKAVLLVVELALTHNRALRAAATAIRR